MMIKSVLHVLSDREKQIIDLTFVQNKSQKKQGHSRNISNARLAPAAESGEKLREALIGDPSMELM